MTREEALSMLRYDLTQKCHECIPEIGRGGSSSCDVCREAEAYDTAIEALKKAEKYRWHDLRKNPDDLPKEGQRILYCFEYTSGMSYNEGRYHNGFFTEYADVKYLAWKYFEPFEKEATK